MAADLRTWFLYVVRCADESLYTGITLDVPRRVRQHNRGAGAAYTATRRPVTLLSAWAFEGRVAAMKAEIAFKSLTRAKKLAAIENRQSFRGALAISPTFFGKFSP